MVGGLEVFLVAAKLSRHLKLLAGEGGEGCRVRSQHVPAAHRRRRCRRGMLLLQLVLAILVLLRVLRLLSPAAPCGAMRCHEVPCCARVPLQCLRVIHPLTARRCRCRRHQQHPQGKAAF